MRYIRLYKIISSTFHVHIKIIAAFLLLQFRRTVSGSFMLLDNVVAPGYRKRQIDRPIFIIGNPRSGTTFLHRLMLEAGGMASFELWEMLFPAVTARKLLGKLVPHLERFSPAKHHSSAAHETSLTAAETDDVLWFIRTLSGPFAWAYFLSWKDTWGSESANREFGLGDGSAAAEESLDGAGSAEENRFFGFYEKCWKRSLAVKDTGRILVKSSMLTFRIKTLLRRYPDCKLIYVIRDPEEMIPSGMSMISDALDDAYGIWERTSEEDRAHWLENLYQVSANLMTRFHDDYVAGVIPEKNLHVVRYSDLMKNLEPTIRGVMDFIEVEAPTEFTSKVEELDVKQRSRVSSHTYSLSKFGLSAERIRADLGEACATFGVEIPITEDTEPGAG